MAYFVTACIQSAPYLMYRNTSRENGHPLIGNERFDGYCADLAQKIAEHCNFDYILQLVKDGKYGAKDKMGNWNGMVGELTRKVRSSFVYLQQQSTWQT